MMSPEEMSRRDEVSRVKASAEQELLQLPNVTGVFTGRKVTDGKDTGQIAIVVTVTEKKDVPAKSMIPKEINGVPTDVIEEIIEPMQSATAIRLEDIAPLVDTTEYATLEGGMSIGPCRSFFLEPPEVEVAGNYVFTGTLGCIVIDNASKDEMILSNFHVMCVDNTWSVGDTIAQPSRVDTGTCPADIVGTLTRAQLNASVDGAVATITNRPHACEIINIGDVKGSAVASVGMAVRKRGRTTELTHGTVSAIDYTTNVDYGDGLGVVTLTNQIRIVNDAAQSAFFGKKGDSGSVVVNADNNVVGLYFAGNTTGTVGVANQIAAVLSALDVTLCTKGIKKWEKEFQKEWLGDKHWRKLEKIETKEFEVKERLKDYIKDWKEYAYEKFGQWEGYDPWGRIPDVVNPPRIPGGRPPVPGGVIPPRQQFGAVAGTVEERLARIEALLAGQAALGPAGDIRADGGCVDFRKLPVSNLPNPLAAGQFSITVLDYTGTPLPMNAVSSWGAHTGLNAGWTLEAKIDGRCPIVQATLAHFAQPALMEAYNADGTLAGTASMTQVQNVAQTLTIEGTSIAFIRIHCSQDETILLSLCCCAEARCQPEGEKPFLADHKATLKDKELKEAKEFKELKEPKEPKEQKELKEPKEFKEPKELKEWREGGIGFPRQRMSVEERLDQLEALMGQGGAQHFIPPSLRPDLSRGALRNEPDQQRSPQSRMRRQG